MKIKFSIFRKFTFHAYVFYLKSKLHPTSPVHGHIHIYLQHMYRTQGIDK